VDSSVLPGMETVDSVRPIVAAFDVDKTLTLRDCVVPYLRQISSWRVGPRLLVAIFPLGWAGLRRDRDRLKALATRVIMTGLTRQELEDHAQIYAQMIIDKWLRHDTVQRLQWHRQQGHQVVLVSASYGSYLRPLGSYLDCAGVLACEVSFDDSDRCTGQLVNGNCRGAEKERRLKSWMAEQGLVSAVIYAYGDSAGDTQLLAMATWPTRIGSETISPFPSIGRVIVADPALNQESPR